MLIHLRCFFLVKIVEIFALLVCKIFCLKIRSRNFLDIYQVCFSLPAFFKACLGIVRKCHKTYTLQMGGLLDATLSVSFLWKSIFLEVGWNANTFCHILFWRTSFYQIIKWWVFSHYPVIFLKSTWISFFQVSFPSEAEQGYSGDEAQGWI